MVALGNITDRFVELEQKGHLITVPDNPDLCHKL